MNRKKLLLIIIFLISVSAIYAQGRVEYYYKNNGRPVRTRDSADYERVVTRPDSGALFNVNEYYMNGKLKCTGQSTKIPVNSWEGAFTSYYPSGSKRVTCFYKQNRLSGEFTEYYPNGVLYVVRDYDGDSPEGNVNSVGNMHLYHFLIKTCNDSTGKPMVVNGNGRYIGFSPDFKHLFEWGEIKNGERNGKWNGHGSGKDSIAFEETYNNGVMTEGRSFRAGKTFTYTQRDSYPQFDGGEAAFARFLSSNIRYPSEAKKNNVQGRVYIQFVVERDGTLTDIKVVRAPSADLGQEALNIVGMSPKWIPGKQYGQPVRIQFTVPINFSLGNP